MLFRNAGSEPARMLILCTPGIAVDQMFAEFTVAGAARTPSMETLMPIKYRRE